MRYVLTLVLGIILSVSIGLLSPNAHAQESAKKTEIKNIPTPEKPAKFLSQHKMVINGKKISYNAMAGEMLMRDDKDAVVGTMWHFSYVRTDGAKGKNRPVTFVFNGGPGSSSVWLHLGVFGPKRVVVSSDPKDDGAAPFVLKNNLLSLLDVTDLVIVDPIGTGYSRPLGKADGSMFWGVREDARSVGDFIRRWVTANNRWQSPKFLAGESYGTTRAAALMRELEGGWTDISFNGVILISSVLDFSLNDTSNSNINGYLNNFPTLTATAWYHDKLPQKSGNLEEFIERVRQFTINEYAPALLKGSSISPADKAAMVDKIHGFTGLDKAYIELADLKISASRFRRELMRGERKTVGRLDSRYILNEREGLGNSMSNDPSGVAIDGAYSAALMHYMYADLGVRDITRKYNILGGVGDWNWGAGRSSTNVAPYLAQGMAENQALKIYVANGYYDMATPFHGTEMTFNQYGFDNDRVQMSYFEAGHMVYLHQPSIEKLAKEIRAFIIED